MAHITGGGISGNLVRILPDDCCAVIDKKLLPTLPVFPFLKTKGIKCLYFENFLGIKIDFSGKEWNSHNDYSNFNGSFYYPPSFEEMGSGVNAIHHDWFEWVGILYLHDLGPQWGTQMWMHQETGKYITDVPDSGSPDPLIEENSEAFIKTG